MNAPIWSFDEGSEIVNRLCWGGTLQQPESYGLERRLLDKFDSVVSLMFHGEQRTTNSVAKLPKGVRVRIIRHPYIAGFLCGRLQLNAREIQFYVSDSLRRTSHAMSNGYGPGTRDHSGTPNLHEAGTGWLSTVRIDYDNSLTVPALADGRSWLSNYEAQEFRRLIHEVESALNNVAQVSASACEFINSYIWNLSIRKNTEKPDRFGTYTFPMLPGLLLICNPHSDAVDLFLIEETLVHEAIHCFLDWAEAGGSEILRKEQTDTRFIKSPWTGNPLDIPTAFHATLVWFGLGEYFKRCLAAGLSEPHKARFGSRLEFVRKGFRSKDFVALMDLLMEACNEGPSNVLSLIIGRRPV